MRGRWSLSLLLASSTGCGADTPAIATDADTGTTSPASSGDSEASTGGTTHEPMAPTTTGDESGSDEPGVCGDGVVQAGEQCDDGNTGSDDGCSDTCKLPVCGDGVVQAGEQCDAGAKNGPNAACLPDCAANVCGDGMVGPGEACDDGDDIDDNACGNDCAPGSCGNGLVDAEAGEQCDDANNDDTDACLKTCVVAACGDGVVQSKDADGQPLPPGQAEACDDGALNSDNAGCLGSCKPAQCGDGLIHDGVEACDNGASNGPMGACLADCQDNVCGDGSLGPVEACDDDNVKAGDGCSPTCEIEGCGDGVVQPGEACDDGKNGDDDDGCTDQCKLEACGDAIVQNGEQCDAGNQNANTSACTLACKSAVCGDGLVWADHEACDDGPANADDAQCTSMCKAAACGDGLVGPGETCDDGDNDPGDGCGATCISEACGNKIVDPGEACDDGNNVDDNLCTNACTTPEPCNGAHVSKDTCVPNKQCGTVSRPWCSISAALAGSASSPIKVAGSGLPYGDHVVMKTGFDVLGGYEPTFVAPRNPDPATNSTSVRYFGPAVEWGANVDATLDGFTVLADFPMGPVPPSQVSVTIHGTADATLKGVRVAPFSPAQTYGGTTYGVVVTSGSGGAIVIGPLSDITAANGTSKAVGLGIAMSAAPASIVINGAIHGGPASQSFGVEHLGLGDLSVSGGTISAGAGSTASTGILAGKQGYGTTHLTGATVHGGASRLATAVDHRAAAALLVTGGTITGGGVANKFTVVTGILTEGVDEVVIDGAKVVGCDVGLGAVPTSSRAVDLRNTAVAPLTGATIDGATIDGGLLAAELTGVRTLGVPLDVTASNITATSASFGIKNRGIHVTGAFVPGAVVAIHANPKITGGSTPSVGMLWMAAGIAVDGKQPVQITDNEIISGVTTPSRNAAYGVLLVNAGAGHVITGNDRIAGGPDNLGFYEHVGIYSQESGALIEGNQAIVGNDDPLQRSSDAWGIFSRASDFVIRDNALILGGHSAGDIGHGTSIGVYVWSPNNGYTSKVLLEDNTIVAGTSTRLSYGLVIEERTQATVLRNTVSVCPFQGDDPRCKTGTYSGALITNGNLGSLFANNWFFGGGTGNATACKFGCGEHSYDCKLPPGQFRFDSNLCHLVSGTAAGYIEPASNGVNPPALIVNNIFHVESSTAPAFAYEVPWADKFEIRHNDFVTKGMCLISTPSNPVCAKTAAEVNALNGNGIVIASANVNLPPSYLSPVPKQPTVAGYHLDATCALKNLAEKSPVVTSDYDGDPRGDGMPSLPEIGPDECK